MPNINHKKDRPLVRVHLKKLLLVAGILLTTSHAYAQLCTEATAEGSVGPLPCDMATRELVITCDLHNTTASCPPKPMPIIDTPLKSYIKDYSPYVYYALPDPKDSKVRYSGTYYRGTSGDQSISLQEFGTPPEGTKRIVSCVPQIKLSGSLTAKEDIAKLARLEMDNCANQFILNLALSPLQRANASAPSGEDPANPAALVSPETTCQSLATAPVTEEEYLPSEYIEAAWKKLLNDPSYHMRGSSSALAALSSLNPQNLANQIQSQIQGQVQGQINNAVDGVTGQLQNGLNGIEGQVNGIAGLPGQIAGQAQGAINGATGQINGLPGQIAGQAGSALSGATGGLVNSSGGTINVGANANINLSDNSIVQQYNSAVQNLQSTQSQLQSYQSTVSGLQSQLNDLNLNSTVTASLKSELNNLQSQIANMGGAQNGINQVQSGVNQLKDIQSKLTDLQSGLGDLKSKFPNMSGQLGALQNGLGDLTKGIPQIGALQTQFTSQLSNLQSGLLGNLSGSLNLNGLNLNGLNLNGLNLNGLNLNGLNLNGLNLNGLNLNGLNLNGLGANLNLGGLNLGNLNFGNLNLGALSNLGSTLGNLGSLGGLASGFSAAQAVIKFINSAKNILSTFSSAIRVSEPASPSGLTLQNTDAAPTKPPSPFPEIKLATIAASKFEEIYDPSHPFSPRWDFMGTERDIYSPMTAGYMEHSKNAVFCAGVKEAKDEKDAKKKEDLEVKVDVLEFRRKPLEDHLLPRMGFNLACYLDSGEDVVTMTQGAPWSYYGVPTVDFLKMQATSYCYTIVSQATITIDPYWPGTAGAAKRVKCWDCFKMAEGKVKDDDTPPCSTQHDASDKKMRRAFPPPKAPFTPAYIMTRYYPGFLNNFNYKYPNCGIPTQDNTKPSAADLCKELRRPVAVINKLKMRYHNPDDKDNIVLTEGVSDGLTFKEHFGNHMPYPRLWDTGTSIQKNPPSDVKFQDPTDTFGQYTSIVGVGHEATPKSVTDPEKIREDLRCLAGGWGGDVSFGGISIKKSDPITSWTELKLYQSRTYRNWGMACIGRYEKAFKPGSTENVILAQTGAEWSSIVVTQCPTKADGTLDGDKCKYLSYKEYEAAGGASATPNSTNTITNYKQSNYPLGWRGYIASKKEETRFPKFGGSPSLKTGLDTADLGDIILFPKGSGKAGDKPGLPKIAKISKVFRCDNDKNCYLEIAEVDNGKYPDACGTTDNWGEVKTRTIYKPGKMPPNIKEDLTRLKSTSSCEDTKLAHCELTDWSNTQFYRVAEDVRSKGCDKLKASECK